MASVDAVLCRWGYMLMDDPAAALSETRRVLRPGGRVALAVWDLLERNPWALAPGLALRAHGLAQPQAQDAPGPFRLADPQRVRELLQQAGFTEIVMDAVASAAAPSSFDHFWEATLDISRGFHDAVLSQPEPQIAKIRETLGERWRLMRRRMARWRSPARSLVAVASA